MLFEIILSLIQTQEIISCIDGYQLNHYNISPALIIKHSMKLRMSILPQHSFTPLNIVLDIAAMFDGLNSYQQLSPDLQNANNLQAFLSRPDRDLWWGRWFNFHLLHGLQGNRRFDGRIITDGVSVSVQCRRPGAPSPFYPTPEEFQLPPDAVVLGGDPGICSLLVANNRCVGHEDDEEVIINLKASEYHELAFHNKADDYRRYYREVYPKLIQYEQSITRHRTADIDTFCNHIKTALLVQQPLLGFHADTEKSLKWTTYRWKQKALHRLARRLCDHLPDQVTRDQVIIAYGSAKFFHAMRGNRSVPVEGFKKKVRQLYTVVPTSEIRTSKECSHMCHRDDNNQPPTDNPRNNLMVIYPQRNRDGTQGFSIFRLKRCDNCGTIWNRDVNAARNIKYCFHAQNQDNERPIEFTRQPQQAQP
ncbi:hypothetical protein BDA99DRAFT_532144 [Phascolomyces articulosus]|uniref:Cas12f1-like TNB domain-containing protein n=1 Tax=Phascolomyces articulosus TaxID=60185 RepID=A0AAD5KB28_9FUNG|nr:hypothetical protein BDA99DRAFT_532144 [Phascolomyces articulosus]